MKNRLIALLLVVATMLSLMGSAAPAVIGEAAVSEAAVEETVAPVADVVAADESNAYAANIGKKAQFDLNYSSFPVVSDPTTVNASAVFGNDIQVFKDDISADLTVVIRECYVNDAEGLYWYRIEPAEGHTLPDVFPAEAWVFQNYVGSVGGDSLIILPDEPAVQCPICGEIDCDKTHVQCPDCGEYDCEIDHSVHCPICGETGCEMTHIYCGVCGKYDCGVDHKTEYRPLTAPVIPEYTLSEDADFAIVKGDGKEIDEAGVVLPAGKQMSLSAWTHMEGASYRWQVRYDHENDLWVDIQGQTGKGILFSAAMLASVADANGVAYLRFVATAGEETMDGPAIPVTLMGYGTAAASSSDSEAVAMDLPEAQAEGDVPELVNYTVVINYVFENNEPAAQSYTATLAAGSNFSTTVTIPNVMGYLPYVGEETDSRTELDLNITNIQEDVTYTVTYKPTNVNYTVIYYLQNVDNDNHTIAKTETLSGLTNSQVPEVATENGKSKYPGFYALLYERPSIAADGSTVVEVYYDRYYYLMTFDLGEMGYGVEPIYARYGDAVEIGTPTRPGYTFAGWQLNGVDTDIPNTVPVNGGNYVAKWTPQNTEYSVVYWIENEDGTKTYVGTQIVGAQSGTVVSGRDDLRIDTNTCGMPQHIHGIDCGPTCGLDEHTHGDGYCIYNCGIPYHDHTSECEYDCGQEVHTVHTRSCYDFTSDANIAEDYVTSISNTNQRTYTYNGFTVYRTGRNSYSYYVRIGNYYYQITNFGNNVDANDLQYNLTCHTHSEDCCSVTFHDHSECDCIVTPHIHGAGCYTCVALEHTHSEECKSDLAQYVDFVRADENVTVAGDGSSVVNVYYEYRTYTIRYIYARRYNNNYQVATLTRDGRLNNCQWTNSGSTTLPAVTDPDGKTGNNTVVIDGTTYYYISLTAKFGENIAAKWPGANVGSFGGYTWGSWAAAYGTGYRNTYGNEHANIVGPYPVMSADMIVDNPELLETRADGTKVYLAQNMIAWWAGSGQNVANHAYHNYFELLPGEDTTDAVPYNGKYYKLVETYTFTAAHNGTTRVDPIYFNGYNCVNDTSGTNNDPQSNSSNFNNNGNCPICGNGCRYCNKFYYDRNDHKLYFWNRNGYLREGSGAEIAYGEQLTKYGAYVDADFMNLPENYPEGLEPGAYKFGGWYTTADCLDGTEMDWNSTMPDSDMTVYAKWEPVNRTVRFFLDKNDMEDDKTIPQKMAELYAEAHNGAVDANSPYVKFETITDISNNSYLEGVSKPGVSPGYENHPYNGYEFVGWFYVDDNGEEKAFDPEHMPVTQDLDLYGKWSSNVLKEYTVYFKIQGTDTEIADAIVGSGLAGNTKTFDAKGGTDLYENYRDGYFPLTKSSSLTLSIEDETQNTFTFWYVQKDAVPYSVYYVTEKQNEAGTLPSVDLDGKTYYMVAPIYTDSDNRKAVVTETFETVNGYVPDAYQKRLVVDGSEGADNKIVFYYTEDTEHAYYKITHYTQNTDGQTWTEYASSEALGEIGKTYSADSLSIDGFTYDSAIAGTVVSDVLTADGLELKLYYTRNEYPYQVRYLEQGTGKQLAEPKNGTDLYGKVISESAIDIPNYTAVEPTSQTLTVRIEESQEEVKLNIITFYYVENEATISYVVVGDDGCGTVNPESELVKVLNGTAVGSTATAAENYRFVGWFSDEACTNEVGSDAKYVPSKSGEIWTDATYYAKFEPAITDLTITKSGWNSIDENQSFIFTVTGPDGFTMDVVIKGNGSVTIKDLPIAAYTVTEKTSWSWRYEPEGNGKSITLVADPSKNEVSFENDRTLPKWLNGGAYARNLFSGSNETN